MKLAKLLTRAGERFGALVIHFSHGALLSLGMLSMAALMAEMVEPGATRGLPLAPIAEARASTAPSERPPKLPRDGAGKRSTKLSPELKRVGSYVAKRYRVSESSLRAPLVRAQRSGSELGIDPLLIVAVMAIESSFNPLAESTVGAQGLMQVIPRFHMDKIGDDAHADALFDPDTNVRVGSLVIKEGLQRYGSLTRALQYYGGALKDSKTRYAKKVLTMQARLQAIAERADA